MTKHNILQLNPIAICSCCGSHVNNLGLFLYYHHLLIKKKKK